MAKRDGGKKDWRSAWASWNVAASDDLLKPITTIPTGSIIVDMALGVKGWPVGNIGVIWGPWGSYKTAFCQLMAAERLRLGRTVLWFDTETHFSPAVAIKNGMDLRSENFYLFRDRPGTDKRLSYENVVSIVDGFLSSDADKWGALVVIDSLNNLLTRKEMEGEVDDSQFAPKAKMNARWLPQMQAATAFHGFDLLFVGQARANMNRSSPYEPSILLSGGGALHHSFGVRIRFEASDWANNIKADSDGGNKGGFVVGKNVSVTIEGNRFGPSYIRTVITCRQDTDGPMIDKVEEAADVAVRLGIISQSGAWYSYTGSDGEIKRWQGEKNIIADLRENAALLEEIIKRIYND